MVFASSDVWNEHLPIVLQMLSQYKNKRCDSSRCMGKTCPYFHKTDSKEDITCFLLEIIENLNEIQMKKRKRGCDDNHEENKRAVHKFIKSFR